MFVEEIMLKANGTPLKFSDGSIMCRVITDDGEKQTMRIAETELFEAGLLKVVDAIDEESTSSNTLQDGLQEYLIPEEEVAVNGWSPTNTTFLLDKYVEYMDEVGPMKKFKNKKYMWEQISRDFAETGTDKTAAQCENRFKTVKKRKTNASLNNSTSGAKRAKDEYEEEFKKIAARDDSIEPEVMQSVDKIIINSLNKVSTNQSKRNQQKNKLANVLLRIHNEKQESARKRHVEKMELLKNLAESLKPEDSLQ